MVLFFFSRQTLGNFNDVSVTNFPNEKHDFHKKSRFLLVLKPVSTNIFYNWSTDFYFRTIALLVIFSQYLSKFDIPLPAFSRDRGCHVIRYPLFRSFPVSIAREETELILGNISVLLLAIEESCALTFETNFLLFTASILLNKQLKPNEACDGDIGVRGRLNQYGVQRYSTRLVIDSFI